jgi:hypothetical protein
VNPSKRIEDVYASTASLIVYVSWAVERLDTAVTTTLVRPLYALAADEIVQAIGTSPTAKIARAIPHRTDTTALAKRMNRDQSMFVLKLGSSRTGSFSPSELILSRSRVGEV